MYLKQKTVAIILLAGIMLTSCFYKNDNSSEEGYPLKTEVELTYWVPLNSVVAASVSNLGETPFAKELTRRTGVKIKYIHPAMGQEKEAFKLMIASGELTDIIEYTWNTASDSDRILMLNDIMDTCSPNLKNYLKQNPDIDRMVKTDDSKYYVYPFLRSDKRLLLSAGPVIRKDWLDKLGLSVPETYDEWRTVLTKFKNELNVEIPFTVTKENKTILINMMGATGMIYMEGDTVAYGAVTGDYKNALTRLNDWFSNGLLDKNYNISDSNYQDKNMIEGKSGATIGSGGRGIGAWLDAVARADFNLVGAVYPVVSKGEKARFIPAGNEYATWGCAAISKKCPHPEIAAKFLDYAYTKSGHILFNFGVEGESFNDVDGRPQYAEAITNNSEGLTMAQALGRYARACYSGPFVQDFGYLEQYYKRDVQKEALELWLKNLSENDKTPVPVISLTEKEFSEYSNIMAGIESYVNAMTADFISGIIPLSEFEDYVLKIKSMGLDKALAIQQNGYERYKKR